MPYRLSVERRARKQMARLPAGAFRAIENAIAALSDAPRPRGAYQLKTSRIWRQRVGDYRILYEIDDAAREVIVGDVGHRRDIYRGLD